jgi:hypothetical protein
MTLGLARICAFVIAAVVATLYYMSGLALDMYAVYEDADSKGLVGGISVLVWIFLLAVSVVLISWNKAIVAVFAAIPFFLLATPVLSMFAFEASKLQ